MAKRDTESMGKIRILVSIIICCILVFVAYQVAQTEEEENARSEASTQTTEQTAVDTEYQFRSADMLDEHYQKHGAEVGATDAQDYLVAANAVIVDPNALHKQEAEDGDDIYFLEDTGEFVILSPDGFIRTYYITDRDYYDRQ